jgi:hypothetical protein
MITRQKGKSGMEYLGYRMIHTEKTGKIFLEKNNLKRRIKNDTFK